MASTETTFRQAKEVWEVYYDVPTEWKDKMPATVYDRLTAGGNASKLPRCLPLVPGVEVVDEAYGYLWQVTKVRSYCQNFGSRKRGQAPKVWLQLIATEE